MARPSFLTRLLDHPPRRRALEVDGAWWTFGDLVERGERVAGWMAARDVRAGDRVLLHLPNGEALLNAHLGCMALGAVRVPVNAHYRRAEVAPIVEDAAPALVLSDHPELFPGLPVAAAPGAGARLDAWASPDDLTALLFTSGTTGRAKGVPQTYTMWEANLDAVATTWRLGVDDVLHLALPLFHTHGLVLGLHHTLLRGSAARVHERFEPRAPEGVTHVYGVPTWYRRWLPVMQADPAPFRRLALLVSGSDGLDPELAGAVQAATGHTILERYGMTETVMLTSNPFHDRRAGTVGPPLPGVDVRIVAGEVQVRGPSVFRGYRSWGAPAPDAGFTEDGWFPTGDAGAWADGYLRIVGRKKDLVIVGGVNVSPAEVELVLARVPGVAEVGVCGLPDPDLNEIVAAAVVLDGSRAEADVRRDLDAAAHELSGLKRPRRVAVVAALPRNALGKLQRGQIRARCFAEAPGGLAPPQRD